jgi:hypothetical protein
MDLNRESKSMWAGESFAQRGLRLNTLVVGALVLFALAGMMSGFAVGAVVHHRGNGVSASPTSAASTVVAHKGSPTATATPPPILLGIPNFANGPTFTEVADGQTSYSVTAQAIDKQGQAIHRTGITCKLWLVQRIPDNALLQLPDIGQRTSSQSIAQPIPGQVDDKPYDEIPGLIFAATTPQTQPCDGHGRASWEYTISPAVAPGKYDLVLLTDWQGIHYNWRWAHIVITGPREAGND